MQAASTPETSVATYQTIQHFVPEDLNLDLQFDSWDFNSQYLSSEVASFSACVFKTKHYRQNSEEIIFLIQVYSGHYLQL